MYISQGDPMDIGMIQAKVNEIVIHQLELPQTVLDTNVELSALGADFLDIIEMVMRVEEQFGLEISDDDADGFATIAHIVAYVASHQKE